MDGLERYREGLILLLRSYGADPQLAEDFAQEALRILLERLQAEPDVRIGGFLRSTALNLLRAHRRKEGRRKTAPSGSGIEEFPTQQPDPRQALMQDITSAQLNVALSRLNTPRDREVLYRVYILGESREEASRKTGLSREHLSRVIYRAKERMRKILGRTEFD